MWKIAELGKLVGVLNKSSHNLTWLYLTWALMNSGVNLNISARCMERQEC
jgi:hypothetical protein